MLEKLRYLAKHSGLEQGIKSTYKNLTPLLIRDSISRNYSNPYSQLEVKHKVIFVHIPKNAGNGVAISLFDEKPKGHNFLKSYKKYDVVKFNEFYKFSFTRNPWARFYSAYSYLKKGGFGVYDKEFAKKYIGDLDFNSFTNKLENEKFASKILSWTHFIPQREFIEIDGKINLDFLGKVEDMDHNLEILSQRLGLPLPKNKKVNTSVSKGFDFRDEYNDTSVDIIAKLYKDDISLSDYQF